MPAVKNQNIVPTLRMNGRIARCLLEKRIVDKITFHTMHTRCAQLEHDRSISSSHNNFDCKASRAHHLTNKILHINPQKVQISLITEQRSVITNAPFLICKQISIALTAICHFDPTAVWTKEGRTIFGGARGCCVYDGRSYCQETEGQRRSCCSWSKRRHEVEVVFNRAALVDWQSSSFPQRKKWVWESIIWLGGEHKTTRKRVDDSW